MKACTIRRLRTWAFGLGIAMLGVSAGAGHAQAQASFFSGFTNGCFYTKGSTACVPETSEGAAGDAAGMLSYANSSFSGTLEDGGLALNFGSFQLGKGLFDNLFDDLFVLRTTFTGPSSFSQLFYADVLGLVMYDQGYGYLNFSNSPIVFGDTNQYSLLLDDVQLSQGKGENFGRETGNLVGRVSLNQPAQVTPEPVSMVLLGSGLAGIGAMKRRRRRQNEAAA